MALVFSIFLAIASVFSFFACTWLFTSYAHVHPQRRSIPLRMILILGTSDFVQAISSLLSIFAGSEQTTCEIFQYIFTFATIQSLFWSSTLASFSALGVSPNRDISDNKLKKLFYAALVLCLSLAAAFPLPVLIDFEGSGYTYNGSAEALEACAFNFSSELSLSNMLINLILIQIGPYLVAIFITIISYIKVGLSLKKVSSNTINQWIINPRYLLWYPFSQIILYFPFLIAAFLFIGNVHLNFLDVIWRICIRLSGFINSMVYLKMRRQVRKSNAEATGKQSNSYNYVNNLALTEERLILNEELSEDSRAQLL